jgi:hypothetical protein
MVSRLMLNLRDPKILNPISKRTTEGTTVASSNPVVSTLLDSRLSPPNVDEEAEVASPNGMSCFYLYHLVLSCAVQTV